MLCRHHLGQFPAFDDKADDIAEALVAYTQNEASRILAMLVERAPYASGKEGVHEFKKNGTLAEAGLPAKMHPLSRRKSRHQLANITDPDERARVEKIIAFKKEGKSLQEIGTELSKEKQITKEMVRYILGVNGKIKKRTAGNEQNPG